MSPPQNHALSTSRPATPIEDAVSLGYGYAEKHRRDHLSLGLIARARSASEVTANVNPAYIAAGGIANPVAFWSGFAHGVRWYLLDQAHVPKEET